MPHPTVQLEQRLQPLVERLDRLTPAGVQPASPHALVVLGPPPAALAAPRPAGIGPARPRLGPVVVPRVRRADEPPAGPPARGGELHPLAQVVGVVPAVRQPR